MILMCVKYHWAAGGGRWFTERLSGSGSRGKSCTWLWIISRSLSPEGLHSTAAQPSIFTLQFAIVRHWAAQWLSVPLGMFHEMFMLGMFHETLMESLSLKCHHVNQCHFTHFTLWHMYSSTWYRFTLLCTVHILHNCIYIDSRYKTFESEFIVHTSSYNYKTWVTWAVGLSLKWLNRILIGEWALALSSWGWLVSCQLPWKMNLIVVAVAVALPLLVLVSVPPSFSVPHVNIVESNAQSRFVETWSDLTWLVMVNLNLILIIWLFIWWTILVSVWVTSHESRVLTWPLGQSMERFCSL